MREIGSEFWDVPTSEKENNIFPESTRWFLSGRSALRAIIEKLTDCHTVAMPSWCCDSMITPFLDAGMEVHFYPVYLKDSLVQEVSLDEDVLFLMDYFGYTNPELDLSDYKGVIIRDVTHSLFSKKYSDADYYFGSLRKWCGVWTGGYSWGNSVRFINKDNEKDDFGYVNLRDKAMQLKSCFINVSVDKNGHKVTDKGYLKVFDEAEDRLDKVKILPASDRDIKLATKIDVTFIKKRRYNNAQILRKAFADLLIIPKMERTDCPMFVPIIVPDGKRDALRQYLIKHDIYCPVHWPVSEYHKLDKQERFIFDNELSLVCDQRYSEEDMVYVISMIKSFWREQ